MTMVVRDIVLTNTTGAPVVAGGMPATGGQDRACEVINVILTANDVGAGAGQTQNAAGMIIAEFQGAVIKNVVSMEVFRVTNGFAYNFLGSDAVSANYGYSVTNTNNVSTLRLIDSATGAAGRLAANDKVTILVEVGNT